MLINIQWYSYISVPEFVLEEDENFSNKTSMSSLPESKDYKQDAEDLLFY